MVTHTDTRPVFYRLRQGKTLHAFGDPILSVPVLGRPLAEHQQMAIAAAGCELRDVTSKGDIPDARYVIFDEDLFFTSSFVHGILEQARRSAVSLSFGLAPNRFNDRFILPHDREPSGNLWFNMTFVADEDGRPTPAVVPQRVFFSDTHLPEQIVRGAVYSCDQCAVFISRMASPFHLLQVNMAENFRRLTPLRSWTSRWLERFAPIHSTCYVRGLRGLNRRGRRCHVHPTAVIENAVLEDDVIVGAHAILRHSYVGAGSTVEDHACIIHSVLGRRTVVASGNHVNLCMTYDDVFLIHGPYQFSIFGRSSAVFAVINCDIRLDQKTIAIPTDVGMIDSKQPLLGIAYGHRSKVGGGNIIAAGRIVPNDKVIAPPPTIILKVDE
jgi:carbonic anhydrase/acetyltransferase-like protein (isoleucine patch superfamily)